MTTGSSTQATRPPLTARLAAACAEMTYESLPQRTRASTKLILLDTLGAMLSASRPTFPGTQRLSAFVQAERSDGPCLVAGTGLQTSATNAALMNGYLAYAMDIESYHGPSIAHDVAGVLPAALAVTEVASSSGSALLAAVALGIEIACRTSLAIGPNDLYARGFHPSSVGGAFGAAVAAGRLLGLDARQMEHALGLAATQAGGLLAWASDQSEESRPFNPGLAARTGVTAAQLAALGFGAPQGIFDADAKYNVFRAWSLNGTGAPEQLVDGLGERFAVDEHIFKRHACCAFLHPAVDGLLAIVEDESVAAEDILAITMRFPRSGAPIIDGNPLRSHRAQYILPLAAVRGRVQFEDVIADRSSEPAIRRLAGVTKLVHDDELDRLYPERYTTVVDVVTRNRGSHSRRVDWARGNPQNPMSRDEIIRKFQTLAGQRVDGARADRIVALVETLDRMSSLDELLAALAVP